MWPTHTEEGTQGSNSGLLFGGEVCPSDTQWHQYPSPLVLAIDFFYVTWIFISIRTTYVMLVSDTNVE